MKNLSNLLSNLIKRNSAKMEKNLYIDASHPEETESFLKQVLLLKNMNLKTKTI